MATIDNDKLHALVGKMLGDLGGAYSVPTARIGFRLGLFDALHDYGAATAAELPMRPAWPSAMCANGRWPRRPTAMSTYDPSGSSASA